jgi:tetratricopeptide (TPR) repeat protein
MTSPLSTELDEAIQRGIALKDRSNMAPSIAYFRELLGQYPGNGPVLYEVAGAYDTAGDEEVAAGYYEQAFAAGLEGDVRRRALLQYGSTLRNLDRFDESLAVLTRAREEFPDSPSLRVFVALTLHAAGRHDRATAEFLALSLDTIASPDLQRYAPGLRGLVEYLAELDGDLTP